MDHDALVASSSCDASLRIWDKQNEVKCLQNMFPKSNDIQTTKIGGAIEWINKGEDLAVAVKDEIRILGRQNWEVSISNKLLYFVD